MTYTALIPIIDLGIADVCIESILRPDSASGFDHKSLLLVDNTMTGSVAARYGLPTYRDEDGHNLGVARAWNIGAKEVMERGLDYMIIVSASMQFGPILHQTFISEMERHTDAHVIEATGHSWHLIAFHRSVFEKIGLFDENFYPAYFEDIDFGYRMLLSKSFPFGWPNVWVNAVLTGVAQHIKFVDCSAAPLLVYYREKWGGNKGEEQFTRPFLKLKASIKDFPKRTIPELAEKYQLTNWW